MVDSGLSGLPVIFAILLKWPLGMVLFVSLLRLSIGLLSALDILPPYYLRKDDPGELLIYWNTQLVLRNPVQPGFDS